MLGRKPSFLCSLVSVAVAVGLFFAPPLSADTVSGADLKSPGVEVYDFTMRGEEANEEIRETVEKVLTEVAAVVDLEPRVFRFGKCQGALCPLDVRSCQTLFVQPQCPDGMMYDTSAGLCIGGNSCPGGQYYEPSGKCRKWTNISSDLRQEWYGSGGNSNFYDDDIETAYSRFHVYGGEGWYDYAPLSFSNLVGKDNRKVRSVVRSNGIHYYETYGIVASSKTDIVATSFVADCQYGLVGGYCKSYAKTLEWGSITLGKDNGYYSIGTSWKCGTSGFLGPGTHSLYGSTIKVNEGYRIGYFSDNSCNFVFFHSKDAYDWVYYEPSCETGNPYGDKCAAKPTCPEGTIDKTNGGCNVGDVICPYGDQYQCIGEPGFRRCSPYSCNSAGMCGYGVCRNVPATEEIIPPDQLPGGFSYTGDNCYQQKCDLTTSGGISFCGGDLQCPKGGDVIEKDGKCYVRTCPAGSREIDGVCYVQ